MTTQKGNSSSSAGIEIMRSMILLTARAKTGRGSSPRMLQSILLASHWNGRGGTGFRAAAERDCTRDIGVLDRNASWCQEKIRAKWFSLLRQISSAVFHLIESHSQPKNASTPSGVPATINIERGGQ